VYEDEYGTQVHGCGSVVGGADSSWQ